MLPILLAGSEHGWTAALLSRLWLLHSCSGLSKRRGGAGEVSDGRAHRVTLYRALSARQGASSQKHMKTCPNFTCDDAPAPQKPVQPPSCSIASSPSLSAPPCAFSSPTAAACHPPFISQLDRSSRRILDQDEGHLLLPLPPPRGRGLG